MPTLADHAAKRLSLLVQITGEIEAGRITAQLHSPTHGECVACDWLADAREEIDHAIALHQGA